MTKAASVPKRSVTGPPMAAPSVSIADHVTEEMELAVTSSRSRTTEGFALALFFLAVAHMGGSVLWMFSTVLLQSNVEDNFRGRVFAAELMLMTLAMAASNYATGEALDRLHFSPRAVAALIGVFFMLPGALWFLTRRLWDREK